MSRTRIFSVLLLLMFSSIGILAESGDSQQEYRSPDLETAISKDKVLFLDFETILLKAVHNNLEIDYQGLNKYIARDELIKSAANFLPNITLAQNLSRRDGVVQVFGGSNIPVEIESVQAFSRIDLELKSDYLFGVVTDWNERKIERYLFDEKEQAILSEAAGKYLNLLRYKEEILKEIDRYTQAELNVKEREIALELGDDIRLNVLIARQELERARANLSQLRADFYTVSDELINLINLDQDYLLLPLEDNGLDIFQHEFLHDINALNVHGLISYAFRKNPSLKAQHHDLKAKSSEEYKNFANFFMPDLRATAQFSQIGPDYDSLNSDEQYALYLEYDAFRHMGFEALTNYTIARKRKKQSKNLYSQVKQNLRSTVTNQYLGLIANRDKMQSNQAIWKASQESYRDAEIRLEEGIGTPYSLSVARADLSDARADYYQSVVNYKLSQVNILKTLGLINIPNLISGLSL